MRAFLPPVVLPPRTRLLAAVVLAACGQALWAQAADPPTRSVLLLHSCQQGPAWVQNITDGVLSVLRQSRE